MLTPAAAAAPEGFDALGLAAAPDAPDAPEVEACEVEAAECDEPVGVGLAPGPPETC